MSDQASGGEGRKHGVTFELLPDDIGLIRLGAEHDDKISLSFERLESLEAAVHKVSKEKLSGLIITGSDHMFSLGLDISLLCSLKDKDAASQFSRNGQELCKTVQALPFPSVAAICGMCAGAALDLAISCSARVIADDASISAITNDGALPAFGLSSRLPQLIGISPAVRLLEQCEQISAYDALKTGLVDEVVPAGRLMNAAVKLVMKRKIRQRMSLADRLKTFVGPFRRYEIGRIKTTCDMSLSGKVLPAMVAGLEQGAIGALRKETDAFADELLSTRGQALLSLSAKVDLAREIGRSAGRKLGQETVCIAGTGNHAARVAAMLAIGGCQVIIRDASETALSALISAVKEELNRRPWIAETDRSFILNRIETTTGESPNASACSVVIDCTPNETGISDAAEELLKTARHDAILVTTSSCGSTCGLPSGAVANRCVGVNLPFWSRHVENMVEINWHAGTGNRALALLSALFWRAGLTPVIAGCECGGVTTRLLGAYLSEADALISEGYSPDVVDQAALSLGMREAPFTIHSRLQPDELEALQASASAPSSRNGAPEKADKKELSERFARRLAHEAQHLLESGAAGTPGPEAAGQIDLAAVYGVGFPAALGGPLHYKNSGQMTAG